MRDPRSRFHLSGLIVVLVAVAWIGVMGGLAGYLSNSQGSARRAVTQLLAARAQMGAEFAALFVQGTFMREQAQARRWLASPKTTMAGLQNASSAMGVEAAVLLDGSGHVLQVLPAKPALLGQVITGRYAHLAAAVAGRTAVSNVVPSASRGSRWSGSRSRFTAPRAAGCSAARSTWPRPRSGPT